MRKAGLPCRFLVYLVPLWVVLLSCSPPPSKKYYALNYIPTSREDRLKQGAYPFTIRLRDLEIEEAYARPQIVYRKSPFELRYYFYRVWAVKPTRMLTDLVQKHLASANLVSAVVRRFDEGYKPDYELSGMIEAIEEYDSEEIWFAHLAIRFKFTDLRDGKVLYNRRFDHRKRVYENDPEYVIKEMSAILEYILNQLTHDLDVVLAREYGLSTKREIPAGADSTTEVEGVWE